MIDRHAVVFVESIADPVVRHMPEVISHDVESAHGPTVCNSGPPRGPDYASAMARTLFVHAGDEHARERYDHDGIPYWSRAFPTVLEQHGFLDVDVFDDAILDDTEVFERYAVIVFAPLPEARWTPALVDRVLASPAQIYLDGGGPTAIRTHLGIEEATPSPATGRLRGLAELRALAEPYGVAPEAHVGGCTSREIPRDPALDWSLFAELGLDEKRAEAWRAVTWSAEVWRTDTSTDVLAEWLPEGATAWSPAIVRRGHITASSLQIVEYSARWHTSQPFLSGEFRSCSGSVGAEILLLALVDALHMAARTPRVRVLPWPEGAGWVLNVRHDFDRWLTLAQVSDVVEMHRQAGSSATWYWRVSHLRQPKLGGRLGWFGDHAGNKIARFVAQQPRHEVALHTERLWAAPEGGELRLLEAATGQRPRGTTAHGGGAGYFRFQGAPNILWAHRYGLEYTELIERAHMHPHRFVTLSESGLVETLPIICLPKHLSLDRSVKAEEHLRDEVIAAASGWQRAGGLLQVMNHPDVHQVELREVLHALPRKGRLDMTAAEATNWWRRTHVREAISVTVDAAGVASVEAEQSAVGLRLEVLLPDGSRRSLTAGAHGAAAPVTPASTRP